MKEDPDIFDFCLTEDGMRQIARLETGRTYFVSRNAGASATSFPEQASSGSAPSGMVSDMAEGRKVFSCGRARFSPAHEGLRQQKKNIEKMLDKFRLLWYYIGAVERPQKIMREWWNWQTR